MHGMYYGHPINIVFIPAHYPEPGGMEVSAVGVGPRDPTAPGQVGGRPLCTGRFGSLSLPSLGRRGTQAMMSSWVANTEHINIFLMIIIIMA